MDRSVVSRLAVAVAGLVLLVGLVTAPAGAATTRREPPPKSNFAGYTDNADVTTNSVQATVTVPTYTCKKGREHRRPASGRSTPPTTRSLRPTCIWPAPRSARSTVRHSVRWPIEIDNVFNYDNLTMSFGDAIQFTQSCGPSGTTETVEDLNTSASFTQSSSTPSSCEGGYVGDTGVEGKWPGKSHPAARLRLPRLTRAPPSTAIRWRRPPPRPATTTRPRRTRSRPVR